MAKRGQFRMSPDTALQLDRIRSEPVSWPFYPQVGQFALAEVIKKPAKTAQRDVQEVHKHDEAGSVRVEVIGAPFRWKEGE